MKRKKKKILAFLLALTLMVSLMSRDQLFVAAENTQAVETESSAETQIVEENGQQDDVVPEAQTVSEEQPAEDEDLPAEVEELNAEDVDGSGSEQSDEVNGEERSEESSVSAEEFTEIVTTQSPSEETSTVESSSTEEVSETEESEEETATEETTEETTAEETTEETEETETVTEEETETEDGSYKGSEDDPWEAKADGIKIKAYADKGVLPEDAVMIVSKLSEDSEEYKKSRELVKESGTEFNEMMALDISFEAENDEGEVVEIEPDGTVRVTMELPEIIPANVEEDSLTINHIKEDEEGKLLEAVPVADKGNDTEGTIEVVDTVSEDTQDVKAEFVTDGFSVFAVTWITMSLYSQLTLDISDSVKTNGLFTAVYEGEVSADANVTYSWYRSDDGNGWTEVKREKITGDSYNITEDGRSVNVALDNGAQKWYKVTMLVNGEEAATSDPMQVKYYDSLQNGSFEEPICTTEYQPFRDGGTTDVVWRTTASDNKIEYVSADSKFWNNWENQSLSEKYHMVDAAADGTQFAELNANQAGALYQDVLTTPGSEIYWRVSHRGRGKDRWNGAQIEDKMYVVIVSTNKAEEDNIVTQDAVKKLIRNIESGNEEYIGAFAKEYGATNVSWVEHGGTYVVPEGQYLTRFFFVAGSTASDDETVGNHIDKVWFSTELPPPSPDKGHLTVTKTVDGLTSEEMKAYSVEIVIGNEQYILSNFTENADGSYSASHTFEDLKPNAYNVSENVIKEKIENFDTKYTEISTAEVGGNTITGKSIRAKIEDGKTTVVNFTNTYEKKNSDLIIVKQFSSNLSENEINGLLGTLTFTVTNDVDVNRNSALTKNSDGTYSVCFAELKPGKYTVTESGYELEGYYCTVSNDISDANETNTVEVTLEKGVDKRITFTNTYMRREEHTITVNKTVTGDMGDREKEFGFTIEVKDGNKTVSVDGTYEIGENEKITVTDGKFSLTSGQSVTFANILDGCVFTVTENDYADVGYTTTTDVTGLASSNYKANGNKAEGTLKDGNAVISYTNAYRVVSPPTGIFQNTTPYLLILLFGIVATMWFTLTRRRRD